MAYINVDHSKFEPAASAVEQYIQVIKTNMGRGDSEVNSLNTAWEGRDYVRYKAEWEKLNNPGSVKAEYIKALENYAQFLRYAGNKYKNAQADAVNRAAGLPKW